MLIIWGNSPWLYKLSTSSLARAAVAVDCAAFCCLASCAVYCVLRLALCRLCADCLYACAAYDLIIQHAVCPNTFQTSLAELRI